MSRRSTRRPPRLVSSQPVGRGAPEPRHPSPRSRVLRAKVAGDHDRLGRNELLTVMRRIVVGDPSALLGLERFDRVDLAELRAAAYEVWGWRADDPVAAIEP